jgi:uncharacterized protein (DUF433 family)
MSRAIVATQDCLGGRYHLAGTGIPIAMIRRDARTDGDVLELYAPIALTSEEVEAAIHFRFPAQQAPSLVQHLTVWTFTCCCGEETWIPGKDVVRQNITCVCGRRWALIDDGPQIKRQIRPLLRKKH